MIESWQRYAGSPHRQAVWLMILTNLLWSLGGLLIKGVDWHPVAIAGFRSAVAAVVIRLAFRGQSLSWSRTQLGGAAAYAVTVISFVGATKLTTAANAILLQYTMPLYVGLFGAWFLNEKPTVADWATIGAIGGGMGLFFLDQLSAGGLLGNICGAVSGAALAAFCLCMRKQKDASPFGTVLLGNLLTALIGLPFMFDATPGPQGWFNLVLLGVVQLGLAYTCYSIAIKQLTAIETALIGAIEPVLNPVWVFLVLGEVPGMWAMLGGGIILTAVTLRCLQTASRQPPDRQAPRSG
ncbi:MAG: DMT family transporter [Sporomusaceae bacterium]|nr:DMT family transporter [Sporomusaceae bacterium]